MLRGGEDSSSRRKDVGILSVDSLACILKRSTLGAGPGQRQVRHDAGGGDHETTQHVHPILSPYDPRFSFAPLTPRRQLHLAQYHDKRRRKEPLLRRKRCGTDPVVMPAVSSTSRCAGKNKAAEAAATANKRPMLPQVAAQRGVGFSTAAPSGRLEKEIRWIHAHLPVLHLATSKCSLALRHQLFAATFAAHMTRALLRKRAALRKLSASQRLARRFEALSVGLAGRRFVEWKAWMRECHAQEQLAACVSIQRFVQQQQQRRARDAAERAALDRNHALEILRARARVVQRALQTHVHVRRLQRCLRAVRSIQASARSRQLRTRHRAAATIQRVVCRFAGMHRATLAAAVAHVFDSHKARCIQRHWRGYAAWKLCTLPLLCVGSLVDQVEYRSAITLLQRCAVGFLCRRHLKKCHHAARRLQVCWRSYARRESARRARTMALLSQSSAACCLQRTFKRNRERIRFRRALQRSARPMYLRACGLGASFRQRFHVHIARSAVSVIQSAWRRRAAYVARRAQREAAATRRVASSSDSGRRSASSSAGTAIGLASRKTLARRQRA
ncbi:hypothetical protein PybrP1_003882 [[Pythium] brassicae (nom. inval.)]|nr:hypothetical protein PybrP1_003882 [[Pythium] brassicae (nom. inval.)]